MIRFTLVDEIKGRKASIDAASESDPDIKHLIKSGWVIKLQDQILTDTELLEFLDQNGPSSEKEIYDHFKIKTDYVQVAISNLFINLHIKSMRPVKGIKCVYVSKKHIAAQEKALKDISTHPAELVPYQVHEEVCVIAKDKAQTQEKEVTVTKAEGKRQRAKIIGTAGSDDLIGENIKAVFWDKTDKKAKAYWDSLDRFKQKLILTEIKKKVPK